VRLADVPQPATSTTHAMAMVAGLRKARGEIVLDGFAA
jgi:hypothetical protein